MGYNKKNISVFVLLIWCGLFSCEDTSSLRGRGSTGADSLDDIEISSVDEKDIVEYEDVYRDPGVVIHRKKFWLGYKNFASTLKTDSVLGTSSLKGNSVASVLGNKKLVMVTPAIWEDESHFLVQDGDRKNTREYRLFDQLGDFFIHPMNKTIDESPNGITAFSKWVWGYGEKQDVYMDIFEEAQSVYLVVAFPIHKKYSRQELDRAEAIKIKELQRGIGNYILRGRVLLWPFGTSLDHFFSQRLTEVSLQFSDASYEQLSTFVFGAQALVTQYRAIAEDTFVQMSGNSSDGFIHSNAVGGVVYYPPGSVTQSIAYSEAGRLDLSIEKDAALLATENSVLMIPFLIQKVLTKKEGDTSQKGFLLRGNPLAMRVVSLHPPSSPFSITYPDGVDPVFPSPVEKIDLETGSMESLDSFVKGKESELRLLGSYVWSFLGVSSKKKEKEEKKQEAQTIFRISDESSEKVKWTQESVSEVIRGQFDKGQEGGSQQFSWSALKKVFEKDTSKSNLFRAKKKLFGGLTDENFESIFDWRRGVAQHSKMKDYNIKPILQHAGFDLIFWPEEDLDYVKSFMSSDLPP